jgi:hypothetical protein
MQPKLWHHGTTITYLGKDPDEALDREIRVTMRALLADVVVPPPGGYLEREADYSSSRGLDPAPHHLRDDGSERSVIHE